MGYTYVILDMHTWSSKRFTGSVAHTQLWISKRVLFARLAITPGRQDHRCWWVLRSEERIG
eukprot:2950797-Pleurochrysis_carterae.AAC.1